MNMSDEEENYGDGDEKALLPRQSRMEARVGMDERSKDHDDFYTRYGWGRYRPDYLQFLNKPIWLVTFLSLLLLFTSINFDLVMIQTFERRFHLTSTNIGTSNVPASILAIFAFILVAHFSDHGNKSRWIAYTAIFCVFGDMAFISARYVSPRTDTFSPMSLQSLNNTKNVSMHSSMCIRSADANNDECLIDGRKPTKSYAAWYVICIGKMFGTIGFVSHGTTALSYVDENVPRSASMFYTGILLAAQGLSVAVTVVLGTFCLTIHEDFDRIDVSKLGIKLGDANWIGAWWLAFLIKALSNLIVLIPVSGFPRRLPRRTAPNSNANADGTVEAEANCDHKKQLAHGSWKEVVERLTADVKTVLSRRVYLWGTFRQAMEMLIIAGMVSFMAKYLEAQYGYPTEIANILPGIFGLIPAIIGTVAGGALAGRLKLETRGLYATSYLLTVIGFIGSVPFLFPCPPAAVAGVTVPYRVDGVSSVNPRNANFNLTHPCNANCHCTKSTYEPFCDSRGVTYYSPCFAGCQTLGTCQCAQNSNMTYGKCADGCPWRREFFLGGLVISSFCGAIASNLIIQSNLVGVPFNVRTLALGLQLIICDLLGNLPGSPLFGKLFDLKCILWKEICSEKAYCLLYDTYRLAVAMCGLGSVIRVLQLIATFCGTRNCAPSKIPALESRRSVLFIYNFQNRFFGHAKG